MEMKRFCLFGLVALGMLFAASFQGAQARALIDRDELDDVDWIPGETQEDMVDDFDVGEGRLAEIVAAAEKLKMATSRGLAGPDHRTPYVELEEIDRLKLSINKIICELMDEGCEHMDDMQDTPMDQPEETFASLRPDEYVKDVE
ncbi:hypothetical protein Mapa_001185 [Marchantia paleacea]|nr:hypothetical protein Mapa_001185 [Marchantia paleacea]